MTIFDIEKYEEILHQQVRNGKLSILTARGYVHCIERIRDLMEEKNLDIPSAVQELCTQTQQGGKYIAAVKKYERDVLDAPMTLLYGPKLIALRQQYRQNPIGREPSLPEATYLRKINRLNNEQLKIALRLQIKSGLRIAEIGALRKEDVTISNEDITLHVRCGKGQKERFVSVIQDEYLKDRLIAILGSKDGSDSLFDYSTSYLKKKAAELGIPTHDLRRVNSRMRYREQRGSGEGRRSARKVVQKELGHEAATTTNAYLGKEWEEENETKARSK